MSTQTYPPKKLIQKKPPLVLDVLLLISCIAISYLKPVPFPWKVPLIAAVIISYIYYFYHNTAVIGLGKFNWKSTLGWGLLIAVTIVVGISNMFNPIMEKLLNKEVDTSAYGELAGNLEFVQSYWWKAMLSAAVAEEIFYRGFAFYVLGRLLQDIKYDKVIIVLITALYFGLSHSFQGITGVLGISLAAIVFGSGYYLSKKNLYALILAHALVDSWSLFSLYKGGIRFFFE